MSRRHAPPPAQADHDDDAADRGRVDKWLWAARFFKTRSLAAEAVDGGRVLVNGERPKRAKQIQVGDELRIRLGAYEHVVRVRALSGRRGPASEAATLYEETPESRDARARLAEQMRLADAGWDSGRPTKRDRRDIERLKRPRGY